MKNYLYLTVFIFILTLNGKTSDTKEKNVSKAALDLHKIFNKKLVAPLKLGSEKNILLLNILNGYSRKTLVLEDLLTENLLSLNSELKKKSSKEGSSLKELSNARISLLKQINDLEMEKLEKIKGLLSPQKLSYYFILKQKLINKFKKSIDIGTLTGE
jgi:hypothetical protein